MSSTLQPADEQHYPTGLGFAVPKNSGPSAGTAGHSLGPEGHSVVAQRTSPMPAWTGVESAAGPALSWSDVESALADPEPHPLAPTQATIRGRSRHPATRPSTHHHSPWGEKDATSGPRDSSAPDSNMPSRVSQKLRAERAKKSHCTFCGAKDHSGECPDEHFKRVTPMKQQRERWKARVCLYCGAADHHKSKCKLRADFLKARDRYRAASPHPTLVPERTGPAVEKTTMEEVSLSDEEVRLSVSVSDGEVGLGDPPER